MNGKMVSYIMLLFGAAGILANWVAGKMLNKSIPLTTAFFLSGTILIPLLFYYSGGNTISTIGVIVIWGFLYSPSFLNASTYMISSAPNSLEFANSLATSFDNLGVSMGTTAGGWIIATRGVVYTPWIELIFGVLALLLVVWRSLIERKQN